MPKYDYICEDCGEVETKERRISKRNEPDICSHCEGLMLRDKVNRGTGFVLKGGGWYRDGYSKPTGNGQ